MADKASEYRATLNLPRTEFPMKADLVKREPEFLRRWDQLKLYEAMRAARKGAPKFVLHDGPPYANGTSHLGHLLNNILKDAVLKYKFMRGFDVPFVPGWDCHGQPTEHAYLKASGINPRDVNPLELRRACAEYAMKWVRTQREQRKRVGVVGDWEHPYLTMDKELVAAEIEAVGRMIRDGYIFRGRKPVLWCWSCETALAENSVEHKPHIAPSVYVKFHVRTWPRGLAELSDRLGGRPVSAVIWTTTPWTLPANVAIAVHPGFSYDLVEAGGEVLLLASDLAPKVLLAAGVRPGATLATVDGKSLEGTICAHPFLKRDSVVVLADYVELAAGTTGLVHTAPGHGEEDFQSGLRYRLPVLAPVDEKGRFTEEFGPMQGMHVFEADPRIVALLKSSQALLHADRHEHAYPFCWRCKNPVIFRATEQWFISLDHLALRPRAIAAAQKVSWYPASGMERIGKMVELRPDWCISRQRSWGVPIPVFYCAACGHVLATEASLNAVRNWVAFEGPDIWWTKDAATLLPQGTRCEGCGGRKFRKETDTLDPWFDSGVTHTSVVKAARDLHWPADLYVEASDQFRGWFQSSLLTSVALHGRAPYEAVLVHGWVLDPEGEKMSKSLGNVVTLEDAVNRWGADLMRLWGLAEDFHDDMRIRAEAMDRITDAYRKLRNSLRYLLGNVADWPGTEPEPGVLHEADRWMRARLAALAREVTADLDGYGFHLAMQKIQRFCTVDLSAFYVEAVKDRLYASRADDPGRRAAQAVLAEILTTLARLLAPVLPFTAEDAWSHAPETIRRGTGSVHLASWPEPAAVEGEAELLGNWNRFLGLRDVAMKALEAARTAGGLPNPLEAKLVVEGAGTWPSWLEARRGELAELLVVSRVETGPLAAGGEEAAETPQGKLRVRVERAAGGKCARCWLVRPEVSTATGSGSLCARCAAVVGS